VGSDEKNGFDGMLALLDVGDRNTVDGVPYC